MLIRWLALGPVLCVALSVPARAQTTAFWVNSVSGNWTDATRWSTNPVYPDNTGAATFNAVISAPFPAYTVTVDDDILIDNFTFDQRASTLTIATGRALRVDHASELRSGIPSSLSRRTRENRRIWTGSLNCSVAARTMRSAVSPVASLMIMTVFIDGSISCRSHRRNASTNSRRGPRYTTGKRARRPPAA